MEEAAGSLFNMILQSLPDAVMAVDREGRVIAWNDQMTRLTGIGREGIVGRGKYEYAIPLYGERKPILVDLVGADDSDTEGRYSRFIKNRSTLYAEGYAPKAYSGTGAYLSGTASPLFDAAGVWIGAIEIIRDITELKRIETELKDSELQFRLLVENIQFGISLIDRDYNLVWTNPAQSGMFDKTGDMPRAGKCYQENEKRDSVCPHCPGTRAMATGKVHSVETLGIRDDGSSFNARVTAFPYYTADGELTGFIEIVEDISERVKSEILLKESLTEKETLLHEVHHRVKNNLQLVISLLTLQADEKSDPRLREQFLLAINRIQSISCIHENLYLTGDFSRIDFDDYITSISRQLLQAYAPEEKKPRIIWDLQPVYLDIVRAIPCGLIVNEILTNALKYAFPDGWKGDPEIRLSLSEEKDMITLSIADNGVGGKTNKNPEEDGETLGLTLVSILSNQLKGEYEIRNEKGTVFSIRFAKT